MTDKPDSSIVEVPVVGVAKELSDVDLRRLARAEAFADAASLVKMWAEAKETWTAKEVVEASYSFSNEAFLIRRDIFGDKAAREMMITPNAPPPLST